jgi:hypothetical protein
MAMAREYVTSGEGKPGVDVTATAHAGSSFLRAGDRVLMACQLSIASE